MKKEKSRTSKTSKTKPVSRTKVVIAKITAVRIPDKFTKETRMSAQGFLKDAGFITKPSKYGFIDAVSPAGEEMVFYAEYEPPKGGSFTPFRMVRLYRGTPRVLDKGTIHTVISRSDGGPIDFTAEGDDVEGWEFVAEMTNLGEMPDRGSYVVRESSDDSDANGRCSNLPNSVHAGPPTTSEVMIAAILEHQQRVAAPIKSFATRTDPQTKSNGTPDLPSPSSFDGMKPGVELPNRWPFSTRLREHMRVLRGNDQSVEAISTALHELSDREGLTVAALADRFKCNPPEIRSLMAVQNLDPALKPFLDKPRGHPERITPGMLDLLVRFPLEEQVKAWNEAKKGETSPIVIGILEELVKPYFVRRKFRRPWFVPDLV